MPAIPPIAVKIIEERERKLSPQMRGIQLPIVDPIIVVKRMICLLPMLVIVYNKSRPYEDAAYKSIFYCAVATLP